MISELIEDKRISVSSSLDRSRKSDMGQFFTPKSIATFMASLFEFQDKQELSVLEPGAGIGSLAAALLDRLIGSSTSKVSLTAYELDKPLARILKESLLSYGNLFRNERKLLSIDILQKDYIESIENNREYDFAILNPPYGKINSQSRHRILLRRAGIETVNLYTAFVALALKQLKQDGQMVAIIPRSFCNGPYYKPFRNLLLQTASIQRIHLFESRNMAFADDGVLQENIIIHLKKGGLQPVKVILSTSYGVDFGNSTLWSVPFKEVIDPNDLENFIHIPSYLQDNSVKGSDIVNSSLNEIGVSVSTGPVVDFRVKEFLRKMPSKKTAPLIYPAHFNGWGISYPIKGLKKNNAIVIEEKTLKSLFPNGFYTVVRRFSSKEEKRRIVAKVIRPQDINSKYVAFENHLNVFHLGKKGILEDLAYGLAAYLNSSHVDAYFRTFSGHTQVNSTDLRMMKYPNRESLSKLGKWAKSQKTFNLINIDKQVSKIL